MPTSTVGIVNHPLIVRVVVVGAAAVVADLVVAGAEISEIKCQVGAPRRRGLLHSPIIAAPRLVVEEGMTLHQTMMTTMTTTTGKMKMTKIRKT